MEIGTPPQTYIALLVFVAFVPLSFFIGQRPKKPIDGAMLVFLLSIMFLPEHTRIDPPLIPAIEKHELGVGLALLTILIRESARIRRTRPFRGIELLMIPLILGAIFQVSANGAPVIWETNGDPIVLEGLTYYDGISNLMARTLTYWAPFYLGRVLVRSPEDLRRFVRNLVIAALVYSFFSMVEQIISPQLHRAIYGYHQHEFLQTRRMGGWRPMIFMSHGLVVAMFMLIGGSGAIVLSRVKERATRFSPRGLAIWQVLQVVLMKSTGALIFGIASLSVLAFTSARTQLRVALIFVAIIMAYPLSKVEGVFPAAAILSTAKSLTGEQRGESLGDRFRNDAMLVDRAKERMYFGWGGYKRSEVFNRWGQKETVPDATWVILMGHMGLVGLLPFFTIMCWPIIALWRTFRRIPTNQERLIASGVAMMIITYGFDLLLNSMQNGLPMLLPGALMGAVGYYRGGKKAQAQRMQKRVPVAV